MPPALALRRTTAPTARPRPAAKSQFESPHRPALAMRASSVEEAGALLARSDSGGGRRRRSASPRPGTLRRQSSSFREDVGRAASETYLVSRLTFTLLQCLG